VSDGPDTIESTEEVDAALAAVTGELYRRLGSLAGSIVSDCLCVELYELSRVLGESRERFTRLAARRQGRTVTAFAPAALDETLSTAVATDRTGLLATLFVASHLLPRLMVALRDAGVGSTPLARATRVVRAEILERQQSLAEGLAQEPDVGTCATHLAALGEDLARGGLGESLVPGLGG
jgi:hypothetical protein